MRWQPYVPVRQRRASGLRKAQRAIGKGKTLQPICIEGRKVAKTFWGNSWCTHLEDLSDFANRLPRGRTYARNGSIVHLEIATGKVTAMVAGSDLYRIQIRIDRMSTRAWKRLCDQCASSITSTIDLLRGKLPEPVLQTLTDPDNDLFPRSSEIKLACDCPDWAVLCKHLAAVLYGVGSRLDDSPELLFNLRGVDPNELIGNALIEATDANAVLPGAMPFEVNSDVEDIFGIELIDDKSNSTKTTDSRSDHRIGTTAKKKTAKKPVKKKIVKKSAKKKTTKRKTPSSKKSASSTKRKTRKKSATKKSPSKQPATGALVVKRAKRKGSQSRTTQKKKAAKKTTRKPATATRRKK